MTGFIIRRNHREQGFPLYYLNDQPRCSLWSENLSRARPVKTRRQAQEIAKRIEKRMTEAGNPPIGLMIIELATAEA